MKLLISIWLNFALLFVFTAAPISHALACGGKAHKKEVKCKKHCKKNCCKKGHSKHKKGNCNDDCNGNCDCTTSAFFFTVLEEQKFTLSLTLPNFEEKQAISYKTAFPKSVFLSFWQPPKIWLFIIDSHSSVLLFHISLNEPKFRATTKLGLNRY